MSCSTESIRAPLQGSREANHRQQKRAGAASPKAYSTRPKREKKYRGLVTHIEDELGDRLTLSIEEA